MKVIPASHDLQTWTDREPPSLPLARQPQMVVVLSATHSTTHKTSSVVINRSGKIVKCPELQLMSSSLSLFTGIPPVRNSVQCVCRSHYFHRRLLAHQDKILLPLPPWSPLLGPRHSPRGPPGPRHSPRRRRRKTLVVTRMSHMLPLTRGRKNSLRPGDGNGSLVLRGGRGLCYFIDNNSISHSFQSYIFNKDII